MLSPPPGTISCLFCSGIISVKDGSDYKFTNHMKSIHEVFDNFEILLSVHFLRDSEKENINAAVKNRIKMTDWSNRSDKTQLNQCVQSKYQGISLNNDGQITAAEIENTNPDHKEIKH